MKKRITLILLLLIPLIFITISPPTYGYYCKLDSLELNKQKYFIDETIKINASWELNYNIYNEIAYIQIQIYNSQDKIIWNSSKYDEIGNFNKDWELKIEFLNITDNNYSHIFYIKFYSYYFHIDTMYLQENFLETREIIIFKRNLFFQIFGFKNRIEYGKNLNFSIKFYDPFLENTPYLINQIVIFNIISNFSLLYESNYSLNELNTINISVSTVTHLTIGYNILSFQISNNRIYNDSKFLFDLIIEKNSVFIDVINFNNNLQINDVLDMDLFFYYYFNSTLTPLNNHSIILKIFNNESTMFLQTYNTDKDGFLKIEISLYFLPIKESSDLFIINIFFNGTNLLQNKTLSLILKINLSSNQKIKSHFHINVFLLILIIGFFSISPLFLLIKIKLKKEKLLNEITFRY